MISRGLVEIVSNLHEYTPGATSVWGASRRAAGKQSAQSARSLWVARTKPVFLGELGGGQRLTHVDAPGLVDGRQNGFVLYGGQIAELGLANRDLLKQSTHDLARSRFRQRLNDVQHLRGGDGADLISNGCLKLILDRLIVDAVVSQHNITIQAFAFHLQKKILVVSFGK